MIALEEVNPLSYWRIIDSCLQLDVIKPLITGIRLY